jgi:hypothetical protein
MRKIAKLIIIMLMILGITLSFLNVISVENYAGFTDPFNPGGYGPTGTRQSNGTCMGEPLNC